KWRSGGDYRRPRRRGKRPDHAQALHPAAGRFAKPVDHGSPQAGATGTGWRRGTPQWILMALIELNGIGRSYWVGGSELKVLKEVSLSIEEGEFVAIVGPSGSGKSTLMQILGLLDRPTYGSFRLLGHDVSQLTDDEGAALRSKTIG